MKECYLVDCNMPSPANMPKGMICNSYGDGTNNILLKGIAFPSIRQYQRNKYRDFGRDRDELKAVHSIIKVGERGVNDWQSVEAPEAKRIELVIKPGVRYSFHEYRWLTYFDEEAWAAFQRVIESIDGTEYDYGQLIDILVKQQFAWVPESLSIFDLGRNRKVCSVACAAALLAAIKNLMMRRSNIPDEWRLMRGQNIAAACPADFAMMTKYFAHPYAIGVSIG